jgi:hypothetical protein
MTESQKRAVASHRQRLKQRGFARYEVRGLAADKELVRKFAQRLAANDAEAERLRQEMAREVAPQEFRTGKDIWDALRRSPAVGLDLDIEREFTTGRDVEL